MPSGRPPITDSGTVAVATGAVGRPWVRAITDSVSLLALATSNRLPSGLTASPVGWSPTRTELTGSGSGSPVGGSGGTVASGTAKTVPRPCALT